MLFSIIAITFLPGILGCCLPDKYTGFIYVTSGDASLGGRLIIDHTQKKVMRRPITGPVEFILTDYGASKEYTKKKDGSCTATFFPSDLIVKCFPNNSKSGEFNLGPAGALPITSYRIVNGKANVMFATTKDNCHPVLRIGKISAHSKVETMVFANITVVNPNLSALNQDVSGCTESAG